MKNQGDSRQARQVFAEIILGSPRARCARFGICEARLLDRETWQNFKPKSARAAKALLMPSIPGALIFVFPTDGMLPLTLDYFFGTGFFKVDVPTELSPQILEALGLQAFVVKKGTYHCQTGASAGIVLTMENDLACARENTAEPAFQAGLGKMM